MSSSFLGGPTSSEALANTGCEEPFQMPLFSLDDTFNLTQPPLDLDNFYQPRLSPTAVVPTMYNPLSSQSSSTPSPPPTLVPSSIVPPPTPNSNVTSSAAATRKKRKKDASPAQDEPNAGFDWQHYASPAADHAIFSASGQPLTEQFEVSLQKIEANTHYSATDNAWICYRQNQFKVICTLKSPQGETFYVQDNGAPVAVQQFCAKLYAIKEINSAVGEEMRVGLHHVGKSRVKKEKLDIGITSFTNGRVEFSNVQFERSNAVKGQQLEYFHLVLAFYAKSYSNQYYHIFSRMSMRLIVRSQNPGFYGDSPANSQQAEAHEDSGSGRSAGNSPSRDTDSPGISHDSLSPLPSYTPHSAPNLNPTTPTSQPVYSFANTNPSMSAAGAEMKFTGSVNDFPMLNAGAPPQLANTIPQQQQQQQPTTPSFHFQPQQQQHQQTLTSPPPFMPTVMNNGPNVNNVNNVIASPPIIRLNSTNINTTTTDIIYNNNNNNNNNNFNNNSNNNNTSFNNNNFNPPMNTFGRDAQNPNAAFGGPWKSEPGQSSSAPGPSSSRPPGGAPGGSGSGGNGSGSGSGGDGNRNGGMGGEPAWQQFSDVVVHHGKVGINTFTPLEALTVNGNILVTGNVYKPSDKRIKSEITEVDPSTQLANVRNLKIYDYIVRSQQERGVLAQELQAIMPHAVNNVGNVESIPNFLVINERVLLFENIGATQQLDKELETEKQTIVEIDTKVAELKETTAQENMEVKDKIRNLFDILFAEENGDRMMLAGLEEEYLNIGFSIFKMGPPRSFFLVGFLFPWTWSLGALYVFSNIGSRRIMGFSNLLMLISFMVLLFCTQFYMLDDDILTKIRVVWVGVGVVLLLINYGRMRSRLKKKMKQMDKERDKKKKAITKKIDQVTEKNLAKMEKREAERKKGKVKIAEPVVVEIPEPAAESVPPRNKEDEEKVQHRKDKAPMKEIQEIEEALRQREVEFAGL